MSNHTDSGTFGRFAETPVREMPEEMKQAYEDTRKLRGLVPGPHKIAPEKVAALIAGLAHVVRRSPAAGGV